MSGVSETTLQIYLAFTAGVVLVLVALLVFMSYVRSRRKRDRAAGDKPTDMSFVVNTFHDLVSTLKEKERELEALRLKAEERAGIAEDYNENIVQSVPSGVISLDESWRVVKVNASAVRILDIKAGDLIGRPLAEVFEGLAGESVQRGETRHVTGSGKRIWLGYSITPLSDSGGRTIGHLLVFTDLTELKALQAQAELRQRLSSLGEMAAGIAHELRNPMGVIAGYVKLLSKKTDPSLKPTIEAVAGEVATMDRIISDFLSFARPGELSVSETELAGLLRGCAEGVRGQGKDVGISVESDGPVTVRADQVLLRQAFTNLLQNAVEATAQGGEVSVRISAAGGSALVSVADTGHGIPEGIKDRIFLPFFTTKEKGTGLGLAIVHKIVTSHGGSIEVDAGEQGASFRVRLPL
jgi:PAS domain S-box-containing protein